MSGLHHTASSTLNLTGVSSFRNSTPYFSPATPLASSTLLRESRISHHRNHHCRCCRCSCCSRRFCSFVCPFAFDLFFSISLPLRSFPSTYLQSSAFNLCPTFQPGPLFFLSKPVAGSPAPDPSTDGVGEGSGAGDPAQSDRTTGRR